MPTPSDVKVKIAAELFKEGAEPVLLEGGHGTTFRAGTIVLKPSEGLEGDIWLADTFHSLPYSTDVRIPRPVRSVKGNWIENGYVAWSYVEGEHVEKNYEEKLKTCDAYHSLLSKVKRPTFLGKGDDPWSIAEQVTWQEIKPDYDHDFMEILRPLFARLIQVNGQKQVIHGDMLGNFLFTSGLPPAVLDFSPGWAPVEFSKGIMLVDAIAWFGEDVECLRVFQKYSSSLLPQYALRAAIRRIVEQPEQVKQYNKNKVEALALAQDYEKSINFILSTLATEGS